MNFLLSLWKYILTAAPFLLFGLLISGFIHVFISTERIKKSLGGKGLKGILKASLFGIPLPLCSCAVIPTAATLKKNGATNSATSSFLISTPESGVDSIAMTYGMMDLPMTIIRPVVAFFSAFFAGVLQLLFNSDESLEARRAKKNQETKTEEKKSCCSKAKSEPKKKASFASKISATVKFAFVELIDDFAFWLSLGIIFGAVIDFYVPADFFQGLSGWTGKFIILAIGIPLYICASATTPIAASLVMKGMSPGTALLILLVGPATNTSNILVISKYIGKRGVLLNIISIVLVALIASFVVDYMYRYFSWPVNFKVMHHDHASASWLDISSGIILSCLLLKSLLFKELPATLRKFTAKKNSSSCH